MTDLPDPLEHPSVDPNTATLEELQTLPGVGPSLAARVLAGRPYRDADDLRRVPGIGQAALDGMRDRLAFSSPPEADEKPEFVRQASERMEQAFGAAGARWASATGGRNLLVDVGLAGTAVIVSMCLTLAVLAGINGSLDVSRQATVRGLVGEVAGLQASLQSVQSLTDSIEGRLQALEGLTARMNTVEGEVERARADLEAAATQVAAMQSTVEAVSEQVETLRTDVGRIDAFLRGLGDLLTSLYSDPTPSAASTPAPPTEASPTP